MKATPEQIAVVEKMRNEMLRYDHQAPEHYALTAILDELKALREAIGVTVQILEPHSDPYVKEAGRILKEKTK